ncbi:MAG TPA: DNA recombination protein RmuC [Mycobacteriales bacterium]|jgi:DNA recombination protein RmuC|nr:DNA recombination protein RmuC [Mycobacteriales bacterium]
MTALLTIVGVLVGVATGVLLTRGRIVALTRELAGARGDLAGARSAAAAQAAALRADVARAETALEYERAQAAEKVALLERSEAALKETFEAASARQLDANMRQFLELARDTLKTQTTQAEGDLAKREQAVAALVGPIREELAKLDAQARALEAKREGAYRQIVEQVSQVQRSSEQLRTETAALVTALRKPQARGQWGELQLRRAVELAGMSDRCDFEEQVTFAGADGSLRPDLVVHLPGNRHVIVDSKCPLDGFLETVDCADEATLRTALARHGRHVRTHIDSLAKKAYAAKVEDTPGFVVLFLPGEALLSAALDGAPDLLEYGAERSVIVATPTTLIALLRSVAFGWRQEALARDARDIAMLGREVYERLSTMGGHFAGLGRNLKSAVDAYNKTVGSMETRVLVSARKLAEYRVSDDELKAAEQVDVTPRQLERPELVESAAAVRPVVVMPAGAEQELFVDEELRRAAGLA